MRFLLVFYAFLIFILFSRLFLFYLNQPTYQKGESVNFEAQILALPKQYGYYQTIYVNLDPLNKVLVKVPLDKDLRYGDYVKISGKLDTVLLKGGVTIFTIKNAKIEADFRENYLKTAGVYSVRQKIIDTFNANLDNTSASLMLGIVFGIKENMPKNFLNNIQITGVMHVIAASGMNVTLVSGFLFYFFAIFFKRQTAVFLSIFGILFYTALAGFQASIIRAAIMGILVFGAQILGKQQYSLNTLLLTGFVMLFMWPQYLLDTGFQLSYGATFGILFIPSLFKKFKNSFTQDLITTTSAQIGTLPILIINFGSYSVQSIVVNALVLWTIPILMILGSFAAVFAFMFPPLTTVFLYLCVPFLYLFEKIVNLFASLGSTFNFSKVPWQFAVAYYLILLSIISLKYKRM